MKKLLFSILFLFSITAFSANLIIESNPEGCEVFTIDFDSGKLNSIGKTPFRSDIERLRASSGGRTIAQISVEKVGFVPFNVMVPLFNDSDIKIKANLRVENDVKLVQDFDNLTSELFDVLRMMRLKDFDSSLRKLELLERKFPHYSIIFEMKATIFYLTKEYKKSLNFYRKAFGLNPKNVEVYKMKVYLERKFKINDGTQESL